MERLQNILSHAGVASRRGAAELIESGAVTVDGNLAHVNYDVPFPDSTAIADCPIKCLREEQA